MIFKVQYFVHLNKHIILEIGHNFFFQSLLGEKSMRLWQQQKTTCIVTRVSYAFVTHFCSVTEDNNIEV